jgi:hypothetical protein
MRLIPYFQQKSYSSSLYPGTNELPFFVFQPIIATLAFNLDPPGTHCKNYRQTPKVFAFCGSAPTWLEGENRAWPPHEASLLFATRD